MTELATTRDRMTVERLNLMVIVSFRWVKERKGRVTGERIGSERDKVIVKGVVE